MQWGRVRRLAVASLVGLLVVSGCARETDEVFQMGDTSVSEEQLEATVTPLVASLGGTEGRPDLLGGVRKSVAELTIFLEVARRYSAEQGITPNEPDYAGVASSLGVSEDEPFVRLDAEASAYLEAMLAQTAPRTPTEEEMHGVYDRFVALAGPVATYDQIRTELLGLTQYGQSLALRDELLAAIDRYGLTVDPRYQPLEYQLYVVPVGTGRLLMVGLPLGEQGTGAVSAVS